MTKIAPVVVALLVIVACQVNTELPAVTYSAHCSKIPRPGNSTLPLNDASDGWFQVYETAPDTYAIVEPFHYQETISHLIVGTERALLFDTGMGFFPMRPLVERITKLPVTVLNSHTHYDHVGGNAEFPTILAVDTRYTHANMAGFKHARIASETAAAAFCPELPDNADRDSFATQAWQANEYIQDGQVLELGGRQLQVLLVPGHTPDAIALLDADNGLLFTGDTYYDAPIWLFAGETSLSDYAQSIGRLAEVEGQVRYLLGAHNEARVDAGAIAQVAAAFEKLRSGNITPVDESDGILNYDIDGIEFVSSMPVLQGQQGDLSTGGSGIEGL
tara:strand:- start:15148 stop:16143 length:996 start_codon:yes stop_codon:yes gene_type:complete